MLLAGIHVLQMIQTSFTNNSQLNHIITNNNTHMKLIELTPREWDTFKKIATFKYVIELIKGNSVFIRADEKQLESLGY